MIHFNIKKVLLFVILFHCYLSAQTYKDDYITVQAILDSNNITTYSVSEITDSSGGRITKLNLNNKNLKTLPGIIGNLTGLKTIMLSKNSELSTIPNELENLKNLEHFYCEHCNVSVFPIVLTKITSLKYLLFCYNNTEIIPDEIGNLSNLIDLFLSGNKIQVIPNSIGKLTNLTTLGLYKNPLSSIPASIGLLTNLYDIHIGFTNITEIPEEIGNLSGLVVIGISHNPFLTEIPASIGNLKNLNELHIYKNKLKSLPASIGNLSNLDVLNISYNDLKKLPIEITKLTVDHPMGGLNLDSNYLNPETMSTEVKAWAEKYAFEGWEKKQKILTIISNQNTLSPHPPQISINNEVLKLYLPKDDFISFYLYSANGQQVLNKCNQFFFKGKHNINVGDISSFVGNGTYIMVLKSESMKKTYSAGKIALF